MIILKIKSFASIRMYELLKQYENIGKRRFELEELKTILKVEQKYKFYADFKRYIVHRAKKDLEAYADICFTFEEIKKGKKVDTLVFHIFSKDAAPVQKVQQGLQNELRQKFLLTKKQAQEVQAKYQDKAKQLRIILQDLEQRYKAGSIEKL